MAKWAKVPDETFCFSCEKGLQSESDQFGPFCLHCFRKTKQREPHLHAKVRHHLVAVVPIVCPHADDRGHRCKYCRASAAYFNVLVLDKNLEPVEITGPYTSKAADRMAKRIRRRNNGGK